MKRHLQTGPHALTVFALRPFVDFEVRASFESLDGRLSVGSGIERALAVSSLGLLSDFFGSWMTSFAWGVWLSGPSLVDRFFSCCRPRLSASFCFCKCGDVSLKAHYPELVPMYLQRSFRRRGQCVRSGLRLRLTLLD
jgi:hypothetical protein